MNRNQLAWWLWTVGSIMIVLSWFDVVSTTVGWCGFGIAMAGSVIGRVLRPPPSESQPEPPYPEQEL